MDESTKSGDDDYVEGSNVESSTGLVKKWTFRKRKRAETTNSSSAAISQSSLTEKPASKTRRRNPSTSRLDDSDETSVNNSSASPSAAKSSEDEREQSIVEGAIGDQGYVEFYNEAIDDFATGTYVTFHDVGQASAEAEDDVTTKASGTLCPGWTTAAIDKFFQSIQQYHYVNLEHIAQVTGKDEEETLGLVQRLERKLHEHAIFEDFETDLALPEDFPFAFEISSVGVKLLDILAERLRSRELAFEKWHAQRKYGRYAILDYTAANELSQMETLQELRRISKTSVGSGKPGNPLNEAGNTGLFIRHHESLIEAAQLLRPRVFLELSEQLFMNSGPPRMNDNWNSMSDGQERPSLMRTFFVDMHTLALRVTKKLVAATLFQAAARLSTQEDDSDEVSPYDVENAAHAIGLTTNWKMYWAGVARRCSVQVFDEVPVAPAYTSKPVESEVVWLSCDEVEDALGQEPDPASVKSPARVPASESEPEPDSEFEAESESEPEEAPGIPSLPFDHEQDPDTSYDSYLEALDLSKSRQHELSMWASLDRTAPLHLSRLVHVPDPPRLYQMGEHVHPNRLRDMIADASDVNRIALENSALRRRRRSSSAALSEPLDTPRIDLLSQQPDLRPFRSSRDVRPGFRRFDDDEAIVVESEVAGNASEQSSSSTKQDGGNRSDGETADQAGPSSAPQNAVVTEEAVASSEESEEQQLISKSSKPMPKQWKGKGRAVPFPTTTSHIEDLVYSSENN